MSSVRYIAPVILVLVVFYIANIMGMDGTVVVTWFLPFQSHMRLLSIPLQTFSRTSCAISD